MQAGHVKYIDQNGDKVINNADKIIIGDPNPGLLGGFNTGLSYKSFQLAAFFTYSSGGDLFNYVRYKTEGMDDYSNQSTTVLDRWRPSSPSTTMPKTSYGDPRGNTAFSDRWIEDGSYLRLKTMSLGYTLPKKLTSRFLIQNLRVYATVQNLLTLTKYKGFDPEISQSVGWATGGLDMGVDNGNYPQPRTVLFGLNLSF